MAGADRGPALADHVLVQVLPRPEPEAEAAAGEDPHRRRLLGDDRRVVADRRAGDVGHQADPLGHRGRGAEHRPGVGRVALLDQPGLEVVADLGEVEARRLGALDVADERIGRGLLAHHRVAKFGHGAAGTRERQIEDPLDAVLAQRGDRARRPRRRPTSRSSASREAAGEQRQGRDPGRLRRDHVPGRVTDHQRRAAGAVLVERDPHQFGIGLAALGVGGGRRARRSSRRPRAARRSGRTRPARPRSR